MSPHESTRLGAEGELAREINRRGPRHARLQRRPPTRPMTRTRRRRSWRRPASSASWRCGSSGRRRRSPRVRPRTMAPPTTALSGAAGYYGYGWGAVYEPATSAPTRSCVETLVYGLRATSSCGPAGARDQPRRRRPHQGARVRRRRRDEEAGSRSKPSDQAYGLAIPPSSGPRSGVRGWFRRGPGPSGRRRKRCEARPRPGVLLLQAGRAHGLPCRHCERRSPRRSSGESPCLLGKTWGYDDKGVWVSDGCSGGVRRREERRPRPRPSAEEEIPRVHPQRRVPALRGREGPDLHAALQLRPLPEPEGPRLDLHRLLRQHLTP